MYFSRRTDAIPLAIGICAAIAIVFALRRGYFPLDWASRETQPIRFWAEMALALAVCVGCLAWGILILKRDFS